MRGAVGFICWAAAVNYILFFYTFSGSGLGWCSPPTPHPHTSPPDWEVHGDGGNYRPWLTLNSRVTWRISCPPSNQGDNAEEEEEAALREEEQEGVGGATGWAASQPPSHLLLLWHFLPLPPPLSHPGSVTNEKAFRRGWRTWLPVQSVSDPELMLPNWSRTLLELIGCHFRYKKKEKRKKEQGRLYLCAPHKATSLLCASCPAARGSGESALLPGGLLQLFLLPPSQQCRSFLEQSHFKPLH